MYHYSILFLSSYSHFCVHVDRFFRCGCMFLKKQILNSKYGLSFLIGAYAVMYDYD